MQGREQLNSRLCRVRDFGESGRDESLSVEQRRAIAEITRLAQQRKWQEALMLLRTVPDPVPKLQTAALDACAKALQLRWAQQLFDEMKEKTVPAYNILINMYGRLKRIGTVEGFLVRMREEQLQPTTVTFGCLINAHGMAKDSGAVMRVLEEMQRESLPPTEVTFGSALAACARCGDRERVEELLAQMEAVRVEPGLGHLTSVITSCALSKDETRARAVFDDLRRRGLRPDRIAYTSLLGCFSGTPEGLANAEALLATMRSESVTADSYVYNQILHLATEAGAFHRARELLAEMEAEGLHETRETQLRVERLEALERDAAPVEAAARQPSASFAALPAGWRETVDPASGQPYFWADADPAGSVTWERPVSPWA